MMMMTTINRHHGCCLLMFVGFLMFVGCFSLLILPICCLYECFFTHSLTLGKRKKKWNDQKIFLVKITFEYENKQQQKNWLTRNSFCFSSYYWYKEKRRNKSTIISAMIDEYHKNDGHNYHHYYDRCIGIVVVVDNWYDWNNQKKIQITKTNFETNFD